jgi:hypothetical protein
MFNDFEVARTSQPLPTTPNMIVDYMATQLLNHDSSQLSPFSAIAVGTDHRDGERPVLRAVDARMGLVHAYAPRIANSLLDQQYEDEPPYVDPYQRVNDCVMGDGTPAFVPLTYGAWNVHSLDSTGGWTCSAVDYARFLAAFDDPDHSPLLTRDTIDLMWSRPPGVSPDDPWYYAAGWNIDACGEPGEICASHSGSYSGTSTFFLRRNDGVNWVIVFNTSDIEGLPPIVDIANTLNGLVDSTTQWPANDLFDAFGRGDLDCDGAVMLQDIQGFALRLTDSDGYALAYQGCPTSRGDMNGDGAVDGGDIQAFVDKLLAQTSTSGANATAPLISEPAE